jgi:hypothetical protein
MMQRWLECFPARAQAPGRSNVVRRLRSAALWRHAFEPMIAAGRSGRNVHGAHVRNPAITSLRSGVKKFR